MPLEDLELRNVQLYSRTHPADQLDHMCPVQAGRHIRWHPELGYVVDLVKRIARSNPSGEDVIFGVDTIINDITGQLYPAVSFEQGSQVCRKVGVNFGIQRGGSAFKHPNMGRWLSSPETEEMPYG